MDPDSFASNAQKKLDLQTLIPAILSRPVMYVGSHKLESIASFIDGFAMATLEGQKEINEFNEWLAQRLKFARNLHWRHGIQERSEDDEQALEMLLALFQEFWS